MPTLLQVLAVVVIVSGSLFSFEQQESPDVKELSRLENVWNEAHVQGDADTLDRLWADDLIVQVTNMRALTKADALGMLRSGRMKFKRYQTSKLRIRVYGDAAVVTGELERTRILNGQDANDKFRFINVYVRRAGNWQVVAWHASTIDQ